MRLNKLYLIPFVLLIVSCVPAIDPAKQAMLEKNKYSTPLRICSVSFIDSAGSAVYVGPQFTFGGTLGLIGAAAESSINKDSKRFSDEELNNFLRDSSISLPGIIEKRMMRELSFGEIYNLIEEGDCDLSLKADLFIYGVVNNNVWNGTFSPYYAIKFHFLDERGEVALERLVRLEPVLYDAELVQEVKFADFFESTSKFESYFEKSAETAVKQGLFDPFVYK